MKNKLITLGLAVLILGAVAGIHYRVPGAGARGVDVNHRRAPLALGRLTS